MLQKSFIFTGAWAVVILLAPTSIATAQDEEITLVEPSSVSPSMAEIPESRLKMFRPVSIHVVDVNTSLLERNLDTVKRIKIWLNFRRGYQTFDVTKRNTASFKENGIKYTQYSLYIKNSLFIGAVSFSKNSNKLHLFIINHIHPENYYIIPHNGIHVLGRTTNKVPNLENDTIMPDKIKRSIRK